MPRVTLACHSQVQAAACTRITVGIDRSTGGRLSLIFSLHADLSRLRIPARCPPCRAERLWEHTCFEAFVAPAGRRGYHEINLAPSGAWALYAFRGYRDPEPLPDDVRPQAVVVRRGVHALDVEAVVHLADLSPALVRAPLHLALSAVVEDERGALSYWALHHPPGRPDFHHPDAFVLPLAAPGVDSNGGTD